MNNKKVILIGHSLGGVLVETYMRLFEDWQDDIEKFIALDVPFDGSSAFVLQAPITGYNMSLPIPYSVIKGFEVSCGSTNT